MRRREAELLLCLCWYLRPQHNRELHSFCCQKIFHSPYGKQECSKWEKFYFAVVLFVWLWRITLNGSFSLWWLHLYLSCSSSFLLPPLFNAEASNVERELTRKDIRKSFFLSFETCSNSIFLVLSFRIRYASSWIFLALIAAKSVTNKHKQRKTSVGDNELENAMEIEIFSATF